LSSHQKSRNSTFNEKKETKIVLEGLRKGEEGWGLGACERRIKSRGNASSTPAGGGCAIHMKKSEHSTTRGRVKGVFSERERIISLSRMEIVCKGFWGSCGGGRGPQEMKKKNSQDGSLYEKRRTQGGGKVTSGFFFVNSPESTELGTLLKRNWIGGCLREPLENAAG